MRVMVPLVLASDCKVFQRALVPCADLSCFSSGGEVASDAATSGGSGKKATQRGSSPLAAVCSPHHILHFLSGFAVFPPGASFSLSSLHKVVQPGSFVGLVVLCDYNNEMHEKV